MELPIPYENVMVTYKKEFSFGPYGISKRIETVTKRGFYTPLFHYITIPPDWQYFNGILLPHGWGGDRLQLSQIIKWEYENQKT